MNQKPLRALIYARLSPTPRGEESKGGNLDQQVERSQARCDAEGWQVVETITEIDTSATSTKPRPGWLRAVAMVKAGEVDVIVSRHYDRMYRKVRDLEDLVDLAETTGVQLVAVEGGQLDLTNASGRAQARYMAVGAALEGELKSERQKDGHARRVKSGKPFWGTRPFGFERDGKHRKLEADALRQAYLDLLAGHSLYGITQRWNETGLLTPKGNQWRSSNLRTVVLHPRNAAIHTYTPRKSGEISAGRSGTRPEPSGQEATWKAIVSPEIFHAVATLLSDPERRTGGGGKRKGLLTHIARCGKCESGMGQTWNRQVRKDGTRLRKYQCRECRGTSIDADWLDDFVINRVIMKADLIVAAKLKTGEEGSVLDGEQVANLRAEEVRLKASKDELAEIFVEGGINREAMRAGVKRADERLAAISKALTDAVVGRVSAERWQGDVEAMFYALDEMDESKSHEELREIITDATVWVKVLPRTKGARQSGPADVDIKFIEGIE